MKQPYKSAQVSDYQTIKTNRKLLQVLQGWYLYTNLIRAQLSSYELALLFYNCLGDIGREKFKSLVEEYALLQNMPDEILLDVSHKELYDERAFGKTR